MLHDLKIFPRFFSDVLSGIKTFEIRFNDRDYKVGDLLLLREYLNSYTGRILLVEVVYLFDDIAFLQPGFVVLGIKIIGRC